MSNIDPTVKAIALQQGQQPNIPATDPQLESLMQSLMIQDADLMKILKGEIHEHMQRLEQMMVFLKQQSEPMFTFYTTMNQAQSLAKLTQISSQISEIFKQLEAIEKQLKRYRRYVPYLMMLTSSGVLSNITEKQADQIFRKQDIMVTRDELDCEDDDATLEDRNFFDSIRVVLYLQGRRNIEGFTYKGLIEEKRTVTNLINDQTNRNKKKILGVF